MRGVYWSAIAGGWSFGGSLGELRKNRVSVSSSTPRILPGFACPVRHPRVASRWANSGEIMECKFGLRAVQLGKALRGTVPGVEHTETRGYAASGGITAASAVVVELSFQGTRQIACRFGSVNASPSRTWKLPTWPTPQGGQFMQARAGVIFQCQPSAGPAAMVLIAHQAATTAREASDTDRSASPGTLGPGRHTA